MNWSAVGCAGLVVLACISACTSHPDWDGSAPVPVSPASGTTFDRYPRDTELTWRPVRGAAAYALEVDCFHCCDLGKWCTDVGEAQLVASGIRSTRYRFSWVGANWGRWRVWALSADGTAGRKSEWQEFLYTR